MGSVYYSKRLLDLTTLWSGGFGTISFESGTRMLLVVLRVKSQSLYTSIKFLLDAADEQSVLSIEKFPPQPTKP